MKGLDDQVGGDEIKKIQVSLLKRLVLFWFSSCAAFVAAELRDRARF